MIKRASAVLGAALLLASQPAYSAARVAVAHFAPFAADQAATEVSIRSDGGDLVN